MPRRRARPRCRRPVLRLTANVELKAPDESKAVMHYLRHALDIEEVQQHISTGKVLTRLAMTWEGWVSFVLTEGLQIKKVTFVDGEMTIGIAAPVADVEPASESPFATSAADNALF